MTMIDCQVAGEEYAATMVATAHRLAEELMRRDVPVFETEQGPTTSHQFAVPAHSWGGGQAASVLLRRSNLLACGIGVPLEPIEGDMNAVRIGTPEICRRGMGPEHMPDLAELIARGLTASTADESAAVAADVTSWRAGFTGVHFTA